MRIKKQLFIFLAVIMSFSACCTASAAQMPGKIQTAEDADNWIAVFLGGHPETLDGAWEMTGQMQAAVDRLGGMKGLADSLAQLGEPVEIGSAYEGKIMGFKAFYIPCVFSAMQADLILVTQDGAIAGLSTGAYSGEQESPDGAELFESMDLALPVPELDGELPGTLTLPEGEGPFPAVVLVHGSGPNDRDETVGNLKPFKDLAEGLAEKGIAVYRYDKRSYVYGQELMNNRQITLVDETITDAVNAVQLLAEQKKIDADRIFVLGHSLGGNAVPAIARELKDAPVNACGFILMAASPRPLEVLMREQYDFLYSLMPEVSEEQQAEKDEIFRELDKLEDLDALTDEDTVIGVYSPYWKWLAAYDIIGAAKEITVPCLLLQGEEDYQVTMEDFGIWKDALAGKENWQMISYPGLTHCFTAGMKSDGSAVYSVTEKVDPRVIGDIAGFVGE